MSLVCIPRILKTELILSISLGQQWALKVHSFFTSGLPQESTRPQRRDRSNSTNHVGFGGGAGSGAIRTQNGFRYPDGRVYDFNNGLTS